jgi:hypothetical protein
MNEINPRYENYTENTLAINESKSRILIKGVIKNRREIQQNINNNNYKKIR